MITYNVHVSWYRTCNGTWQTQRKDSGTSASKLGHEYIVLANPFSSHAQLVILASFMNVSRKLMHAHIHTCTCTYSYWYVCYYGE